MEQQISFSLMEFDDLRNIIEILGIYDTWTYTYANQEFIYSGNTLCLLNNQATLTEVVNQFTNAESSEKIEDFFTNIVNGVFSKSILANYKDSGNNDRTLLITGKIEYSDSHQAEKSFGFICDITDYIGPDEETQRKFNHQSVIMFLTKLLLDQTPIQERDFFNLVLDKITETLEVDCASILKFNHYTESSFMVVDKVDYSKSFEFQDRIDLTGTVVGESFVKNKLILIKDFSLSTNVETYQFLRFIHASSGIFIPIKISKGKWGVLGAFSRQPSNFSLNDILFMQELTTILSSFIDQNYVSTQQLKLSKYAELALRHQDFMGFFSNVTDEIFLMFEYHGIQIYTINDDRSLNLVHEKIYLESQKGKQLLKRSKITELLSNEDILKYSNDNNRNSSSSVHDCIADAFADTITSGLVMPIFLDNAPSGLIHVFSNYFDNLAQNDTEFFSGLRNIIKNFYVRAKKEQELQNLLEKQRVISELSKLSLRVYSDEEFSNYICQKLGDLNLFDFVRIARFEELKDEFKVIAQNTTFSDGIIAVLPNDPEELTGYTFLREEPILFDEKLLKRFSQQLPDSFKTGICCTITNNQGKWGVIGCFSTRSNSFVKEDGDFISNITSLIGLFLERKNISEHDALEGNYQASANIIAGISHEFNNYLSTMKGYAEFIRQDLEAKAFGGIGEILSKEEHIRSISHINESIDKSAQLIRRLQQITKNEFVTYSAIDVNEILSGLKERIRHKLVMNHTRNIEIVYDLEREPIYSIKGDVYQIGQIILNLVTNAFEAIKDDGKVIIKTRNTIKEPIVTYQNSLKVSEEEKYIILSIKDNGIGIEPELIQKIFNPYVSGKKASNLHKNYHGLGLSVVYNIVKSMNGEIKVHSTPGLGTIFNIEIPSLESTKEEFDLLLEKEIFEEEGNSHKQKILVVDDNQEYLEFLQIFLKKHDVDCIIATNGLVALEQFKKSENIGLIITDILMPELNGKELIDEVRKIKKNIPFILISGYTDYVIDSNVLNGKTKFLRKPFSPGVLLTEIHNLLPENNN